MKGPNKIAEWLRHETSELRVLGSNPAQVDDLDSNPAQVDDHSTIQPGLGGYLGQVDDCPTILPAPGLDGYPGRSV